MKKATIASLGLAGLMGLAGCGTKDMYTGRTQVRFTSQTQDTLFIRQERGMTNIEVYDSSGKRVMEEAVPPMEMGGFGRPFNMYEVHHELPVGSLNKGNYQIVVKDSQGGKNMAKFKKTYDGKSD